MLRPAGSSVVQLPPGHWPTVLDFLCARFPHVAPETWRERMLSGSVQEESGATLPVETPFRVGLVVRYWRAVPAELPITGDERILHVDDDLVVADKPPFLPVAPTGRWVEETLLRRLQRRLGMEALAPLHRLDRATSGLVMFSVRATHRAAYHALFAERGVEKHYVARAPALPNMSFPHIHRSRLVHGEPFFRMREVEGRANSETRIDVQSQQAPGWTYLLTPLTGRKHQLRVHMAALGAPIDGDRCYPELQAEAPDDARQPLALLAARLAFRDPINGAAREFQTTLSLP